MDCMGTELAPFTADLNPTAGLPSPAAPHGPTATRTDNIPVMTPAPVMNPVQVWQQQLAAYQAAYAHQILLQQQQLHQHHQQQLQQQRIHLQPATSPQLEEQQQQQQQKTSIPDEVGPAVKRVRQTVVAAAATTTSPAASPAASPSSSEPVAQVLIPSMQLVIKCDDQVRTLAETRAKMGLHPSQGRFRVNGLVISHHVEHDIQLVPQHRYELDLCAAMTSQPPTKQMPSFPTCSDFEFMYSTDEASCMGPSTAAMSKVNFGQHAKDLKSAARLHNGASCFGPAVAIPNSRRRRRSSPILRRQHAALAPSTDHSLALACGETAMATADDGMDGLAIHV